MKKVLVVNVNWLGDVIFSAPVFTAIKAQYPQAHVACLAVPRVREILESIPAIDEIIIYDEKGKHRGLFAKLKLILGLGWRRFDIAFLLHGSWTRALIVFLAGIPRRVGYATKNGRFLTHVVEKLPANKHRSDHYLHVIEPFIKINDPRCRINVSGQAEKEIADILKAAGIKDGERLVVIHIGGNWDLKRWPGENFSQLIARLRQDFKIVIPGGPDDRLLAEQITAPQNSNPVILAGATNLKQLIALMKRAALVISADSGPLHIASAVGTPVIGLFGPTRPETTGPRGGGKSLVLHKPIGCNHSSCYYLECPDNVCMKTVTVDEVLSAVKKMI